ncbi:MAG: hypothetical protein NWF00_02445 [Candidatus Bathyarchaeota archaeon]|nr:hypothetical protein [Candidatus Bathyarchaeota archaeon]
MDRTEAVLILREILDNCEIFDGVYLSLASPKASNLLSQGYQLHIKAPIDDHAKECMRDILQKHGLALKIEDNLAIIYKPIKKKT